jgi:hypothetical protein
VLGALLFVFAILLPRREIIEPGPTTKQLSPAE